jgi:hypothetical protein
MVWRPWPPPASERPDRRGAGDRAVEIAENLHREDLTGGQRADQMKEYKEIIKRRQEDALKASGGITLPKGGNNRLSGAGSQHVPTPGSARQVAKEVGVSHDAVHKNLLAADIAPEAKQAILDAGLKDNHANVWRRSSTSRANRCGRAICSIGTPAIAIHVAAVCQSTKERQWPLPRCAFGNTDAGPGVSYLLAAVLLAVFNLTVGSVGIERNFGPRHFCDPKAQRTGRIAPSGTRPKSELIALDEAVMVHSRENCCS